MTKPPSSDLLKEQCSKRTFWKIQYIQNHKVKTIEYKSWPAAKNFVRKLWKLSSVNPNITLTEVVTTDLDLARCKE